jgi:hypothetical protein
MIAQEKSQSAPVEGDGTSQDLFPPQLDGWEKVILYVVYVVSPSAAIVAIDQLCFKQNYIFPSIFSSHACWAYTGLEKKGPVSNFMRPCSCKR